MMRVYLDILFLREKYQNGTTGESQTTMNPFVYNWSVNVRGISIDTYPNLNFLA